MDTVEMDEADWAALRLVDAWDSHHDMGVGGSEELALRRAIATALRAARQEALEQVEDIVQDELGEWGGPERNLLNGRMTAIFVRIRALAGGDR